MTPFVMTDDPLADRGERLADELLATWARNERVRAEDYFAREPDFLEHRQVAIRVIFEELCIRQELGEAVEAEEIRQRFPSFSDELIVMLDCRRLLDAYVAAPHFPEVGEQLVDFQLMAELGRGTSARVFLARQTTLADRPVVLKVSPLHDREVDSLARLQHTHIIPLYGVHDVVARGLRVLCQPHFGGTTLARLLEHLGPIPVLRRSGRMLIDALTRIEAGSPCAFPAQRGPRDALGDVSYVDAVCWIAACLADALQHAHDRNLVHLDVKPSNVLLAADGQPLLLDFHLARQPITAGQSLTHGLGGTPEYMSPEQRDAFAAFSRGEQAPVAVDHRSDIYSLGRLLHVALGGSQTGENCSLRQGNSDVSVGLSDVVQRCLEPDSQHRYARMADLAADLRRHRAHLPLRGVSNRSWNERWRKWRQRRPFLSTWLASVLLLSIIPVFLVCVGIQRYNEANHSLHEGRVQLQAGSAPEALRTFTHGQTRLAGLPGCRELRSHLADAVRLAQRTVANDKLHDLTERLRFSAGDDDMPRPELLTLDRHCRTAWMSREMLDPRAGSTASSERLRTDLVDLVLLWFDIKARLAPTGQLMAAENEKVLTEAVHLCGPSVPLARLRGSHAGPMTASTAWEHAVLGRTLLRCGELTQAAVHLDRAVTLRPQDYWSHFYRGLCAYRAGDMTSAVGSFTVALALLPDSAIVRFNRGRAHEANGNRPAAIDDYTQALILDPALTIAAQHRAALQADLAALADLPSK